MKKPTIHQTTEVASSRLFAIEALDLEFSNGEKREYERLVRRGHGAVLIVPMLDDETMLLIREYAAGTETYELGFPKGKVEAGEDFLEAANREIMEEVGYESAKLTMMKALSLAPSYMGHITHIILAQDLTPHREEGDEPEELEVVKWNINDVDALIARDDFSEGRSLAALFLAKKMLKEQT
ncbi:MAG TPA: ADP compounds hydrolase NudE [Leucothrix mucor]|nr:ADP compounds hydrolase NudE [Leucothrix mucor]